MTCRQVLINGVLSDCMVDTGAQVNVIPNGACDGKLVVSLKLSPTNVSIKAWGNFSLKVLGSVQCPVEYKGCSVTDTFFIVDTGGNNNDRLLLTYELSHKLGLMAELATMRSVVVDNENMISDSGRVKAMLREHAQVFSQEGKINGIACTIQVRSDAVPYAPPARRVPPALLDELKRELTCMREHDIIEPVTEPSDWCSPTVIAFKRDRSLRICVDLRKLNKAVCRQPVQMPTMEELSARVHGSKVFSLLDCKNSYWQIPIAQESQHLLTFSTPIGRFRFKRLCFGLTSAPEIYQRVMSDILTEVDGVVNYIDDVLVFGATQAEHDKRLEQVLIKLKESGVRLNEAKCYFQQREVEFLGHVWNTTGVAPTPARLEAVRDMPKPESVDSLRSFLGLAVYVASHFVPHFSALAKPLWEAVSTCKSDNLRWNQELNTAFETLRGEIAKIQTRAHFDPTKRITIQTDACGRGLGGVLLQDGHPVLYVSRTLTDTEERYSQLEREFLGIVFTLNKLKLYLLGTEFEVQTDHLPILGLLDKPVDQLSNRLQRWIIGIQHFRYKLSHIAGVSNVLADCLSRNAIEGTQSEVERATEVTICFVANGQPVDVEQVAHVTATDQELLAVMKALDSHWEPRTRQLGPFFQIREQLAIKWSSGHRILLKGDTIVIPAELRKKVLGQAHQGHMGIVKMKAYLRAYAYWPGMNKDIENFCRRCPQCTIYQKVGDRAPMSQVAEKETEPWQRIAIDMTGPSSVLDGKLLLTIIDLYSRFPEVCVLRKGTSREVIEHLQALFARFGVPRYLVSDNGSNFVSDEFEVFLKRVGITHVRTSVYFPSSNGVIERFHSTLKTRLKKIRAEHPQAPLELAVATVLFEVRSTPNEISGCSPFERLFGRPMRTQLSVLVPSGDEPATRMKPRKVDYSLRKGVERNYSAGDQVLVRRGKGQPFHYKGRVLHGKGQHTFLIEFDSGRKAVVNQYHLKLLAADVDGGLENDAKQVVDSVWDAFESAEKVRSRSEQGQDDQGRQGEKMGRCRYNLRRAAVDPALYKD